MKPMLDPVRDLAGATPEKAGEGCCFAASFRYAPEPDESPLSAIKPR